MLWKTAKYMYVVSVFIFPKYLSDAFGVLHEVMSTKLAHNPEELHQFTYLTFFYASATLDEITKHGHVLIPADILEMKRVGVMVSCSLIR